MPGERMIALALASTLVFGAGLTPASAAEREQVRVVINLIAGVKMPFPKICATTSPDRTRPARYQ